MRLFITDFTASDGFIKWNKHLPEILHGQLWRLVTPIFIHFGVLHIFFNMLWLRDLGSMIEGRQSSWLLAVLVLVIAACSNLAQFCFGGPMFGGMSGVVYGLLGYIWMRGKFDPGSGLYLHPSTVTMMIIWFFACFTPALYPTLPTPPTPSAWSWASPGVTCRACAIAERAVHLKKSSCSSTSRISPKSFPLFSRIALICGETHFLGCLLSLGRSR